MSFCAPLLAIAIMATGPASAPAVVRLTLEEALRLAQEKFPLVNEAELQIRVQQAQSDQAFWAFWSPIEVVGMVGGPTPEARGNGRYVRSEASLQGDLNFGSPGFFAGYRIQGAVPLITFGKLASLRAMGHLGVDLATANRDRVRSETAANAMRAYFGHNATKAFLELLADSQKNLDDAIKSANELIDKGSDQVADNDVFMLRTLRSTVLARKSEAEAGRASTAELLRFLVQAPADATLDTGEWDMRVPAQPLPAVEAYMEHAWVHRAELRMAGRAVELRKESLWVKKAGLFPDVFAAGFFTQNYTSNQSYQTNPFLNNVANELNGGLGIGARFTLDIPMKLAQIREAQAELAKAENQASAASGLVRLQVRKAWNDLRGAQAQASEYAQAEKSAKSWVVASLLSFNSGLSPANDLFQAIRSYAESGALRRKAELDFALGLASMCEATGGGFHNIHRLTIAHGDR